MKPKIREKKYKSRLFKRKHGQDAKKISINYRFERFSLFSYGLSDATFPAVLSSIGRALWCLLSSTSSSHYCSCGTHLWAQRSFSLRFSCSPVSPWGSYHTAGRNFLGISGCCISAVCLGCIRRDFLQWHFCRWQGLWRPSWWWSFHFESGYFPLFLKLQQGLLFETRFYVRMTCSWPWPIWKSLIRGFCWSYPAQQ